MNLVAQVSQLLLEILRILLKERLVLGYNIGPLARLSLGTVNDVTVAIPSTVSLYEFN